jgi:diaminopimelate epimerase
MNSATFRPCKKTCKHAVYFFTFASMNIPFYKYQGTGNDFVLIDNRLQFFDKNNAKLVAALCDRRFGIGADGLILLERHPTFDFRMVYYNSDGNESSMCGNGGRCITHFAKFLGIIETEAIFEAVDGMHSATIYGELVSLKMNDVSQIEVLEQGVYLDTGSPHHVVLVNKVQGVDVKKEGAAIRYNIYGEEGANVNFVEALKTDVFSVRTYERGVENETLSCGTGVTAVALALFETGKTTNNTVVLKTLGGELVVRFTKEGTIYKDIYLEGPAKQVFKGTWV